MTHETKMEVIIFTGLAAFLAALWWMNQASGGGTGLEGGTALPALAGSGGFTGGAGPQFTFGGNTFGGSPYNTTSTPGSGANCGCPSCSFNGFLLGSDASLADYIAATAPVAQLQAAVQPGGYF